MIYAASDAAKTVRVVERIASPLRIDATMDPPPCHWPGTTLPQAHRADLNRRVFTGVRADPVPDDLEKVAASAP
jgi:hypothetical protein